MWVDAYMQGMNKLSFFASLLTAQLDAGAKSETIRLILCVSAK